MRKIVLAVFLLLSANLSSATEPDQAAHEALRGLLQGIEKAINDERYADLAPFFSEGMQVTTINQEVLTKREDIAPYFQRWFGSGGFLKKLDIRLTADALTRLDPNMKYGTVIGSGLEKYILSDGRSFDMKTRWTATVIHDPDGQWRILTLHIGTNFLDNPILAKAESSLTLFTVGGAAGGLVIGLLLMAFLKRRKA